GSGCDFEVGVGRDFEATVGCVVEVVGNAGFNGTIDNDFACGNSSWFREEWNSGVE
ncbi:unnamed protein product, partial [Rotaria magnacalcarata]